MPAPNHFMSALMSERINYGGVACRRSVAYEHALSACLSRLPESEPNREAMAKRGAEMFAFGPRAKALTNSEAAMLLPEECLEMI